MTGFFSGWGSSSDGLRERFGTLPERYTQYDLVLAWETKSLGSGTVIDGVVKNVRYAYLDGLEVWVEVLDASGKAAVRASCFIIPNRLRQDQMAPFTIELPIPGEPGTLLRFTYRYQGTEDGGGNFQSFEVSLPPPR